MMDGLSCKTQCGCDAPPCPACAEVDAFGRPKLVGVFLMCVKTLLSIMVFASPGLWSVPVVAQVPTENEGRSSEETSPPDDVAAVDEIEDLDLLDLEIPIVVTATRHEERLNRVPYAMSVITAEDIRRMGARSVPEALRLVPGVDVADLSSANAAVSPRGHHSFVSRELLVLVDGRQIFDSLFGGTLWGSWPFQLEDIARIEVIRGPGGVTWGANAANGVINIITKDPGDQTGLTVTSGGGSRGSFKQHVGYAWREDRLRLRLSGEYEASDGFQKGGSVLRNLEDDYKIGRMVLHGVQERESGDTFTFSIGSAVMDGGYSPSPMGGLGATRNSGSQANHVMGRWSHHVDRDSQVEVTAYVNDFQASPGVAFIDYRYQQIGLMLSHTFVPADDHLVSWGIDSRTDLLDSSNSDPFLATKNFTSTAIVGIYYQDQWQFRPKWTLDAGARIDYEFYGGFQPSARLSLSYEPSDDTMIYGAVSRAFQMPPVGFWFMDMPLLNGLARVVAHRGMDAEKLLAYEFGIRHRFSDRLEASANLFWHEYADSTPIKLMLAPPGLLRLDVDNRADSSTYGVEIEAKWRAAERLTVLGTYTFQKVSWRSETAFVNMDQMTAPEHKFMLALRHDMTEDIHLSSHLFFVDEVDTPTPVNPFVGTKTDAYVRLDLLAEFDLWDDRASVSVGVKNLLDPNHNEGRTLFLNDAEVPRMVYAEFRMTIK